MALSGFICADVPLSNYSLTHFCSTTTKLLSTGKKLDQLHTVTKSDQMNSNEISLFQSAKWYSNSLNCIMLVETTHLTQVE